MELSVIVVSYNAAAFLERCMASVAAHCAGIEHEVCVVDNASTDNSAAIVREKFPQARLIALERNVGFAAGVNAGLKNSTGRFVLWLNPDSEILNDGIGELVRVFASESSIGILGPKIVDPDGTVQLSCRSFPSYRTAMFNRYSMLTRLFPTNRYSHEYLQTRDDHARRREVDWVSGACLLHRRELSEKLRGLDEQFFMYCEDVDFCRRAHDSGWKVLYHPAMEVRHEIAGSSRSMPVRMIREHHRSMWHYYTKHFPRNPLKDIVVAGAIFGRCGLKIAARTIRMGG